MKKIIFFVFLSTLFLDHSSATVRAVIVGIADYKIGSENDLNYTDDDAREFYDFLIEQYPGSKSSIIFIPEYKATNENILQALSEAFNGSKEDDINIFFFSGHGGKGFFIPYDYDGRANSLLTYQNVRQAFSISDAETKLIIGDACHAGSSKITTSVMSDQLSAYENYYDQLKDEKKGIAVLMSSRYEEVSFEYGALQNGVFTYYLMEALSGEADFNNNNLIEIKELYAYVRKEIREFTDDEQTPIVFGQFADDMVVFDISNN